MRNVLKVLVLTAILIGGVFNVEAATNVTKNKPEPQAVIQPETENQAKEIDLKAITSKIEEIEQSIKENTYTRQSLEDYLRFLNESELSVEGIIRKLEKEQEYAQDALSAFGEKSEETEIEDQSISEMREKYTLALNGYKSKLIEANLIKKEIDRITGMIAEARNKILIGNLVAEKNVIIVPKTFFQAIGEAAVFFWKISISPIEWYKNLSAESKEDLYKKGWYVLFILGFAIFLGLFVRSYIIRKWGYGRKVETPGYGQKVVVAIMTALAYGVIPALLIGGCFAWGLTNEDLVGSRFGKIIAIALFYAFVIILVRAAARVVLAPWNGKWRLFNISDARAERVFSAATLSIVLLGVGRFIRKTATFFDASDVLNLLLEVGLDAVRAFVIILLVVSFYGEIKTKAEDDADKGNDDATDDESESMNKNIRIILFTALFAIVTFCTSLFGYPDLASFIFHRFYASILIIGIFVVVRKVISDLLCRSIIFWIKTFRMRKKLLSKVDLLMSLFVTPILVIVLTYMMLRLWGMPGSLLEYGLKKLVFGFKVGGIHISLIAILTGVFVFIISITLVRMLRRKLSDNLLARINMDEGIKNSLVSGVSFIGTIIAFILAIAAMGVDLSNLAVIAGALSVGIGFGLQDIIKNLVAGIIILFERPFKVGDWVILGGEEGKIKQINIRSTELETWTKRSVIIPNATLISSSLINLTHGDNWQRQSIIVGVSYDSDAKRVAELLIECAKSNKRVVKVPSPMVLFKDFGASSLDFELRYHVSDVRSDYVASSEIRYTILDRFRKEGIEIAYPQIVVHQANDTPLTEENS